MLCKIFKDYRPVPWKIVEKETVDEIIFWTPDQRNRLILELMARGGMRIGKVLKLTPSDIEGGRISIQAPKSGRQTAVAFYPKNWPIAWGNISDRERSNQRRRSFAFPILRREWL